MALSAAAFIMLMVLIIGLIMGGYYFLHCYPVLCKPDKPRAPVDPERNYLIPPLQSDHNDNKATLATAPEAVAPVAADSRPADAHNESYPSAPNTSSSLNEGDSFSSGDVPLAAAVVPANDGVKQSLDVPDCAGPRAPDQQTAPERAQMQCRPDGVIGERNPLLQGDDEDGLILQQPSVRSKNTGEPVPPVKAAPSHVVVAIPPATSEAPEESAVPILNQTPMIAPDQQGVSPPLGFTPIEQVPPHMIVTIPQPISVPPERNMAATHPPSHMVVTMPQPLNVPPLMVAPVYDEPPLDDQPSLSLQQQLHPIISVPVTNSTVVPVSEPNDSYGWNDSVAPAVQGNEEKPVEDPNLSAGPTCISVEVDEVRLSPVPNEKVTNEPLQMEANDNAPVQEIVGCIETSSVEAVKVSDNTGMPTDRTKSFEAYLSDGSPSVSPRSKTDTDSESSEPEITEYTFETGRLVPSTNAVLENEISTVSNVRIIRYTSIDDSIVMDANASASDSIRVHVGDANDADISVSDSVKTQSDGHTDGDQLEDVEGSEKAHCGSPDLTIPRRSPDGDSMKSMDGETSKSASPAASPQKAACDKARTDNSANKMEVDSL